MRSPVSTPFTSNWKTTMIPYAAQNPLRSNSRVRSRTRSTSMAASTPTAAAKV
jgi:hypothetical protein